MENALPLVTLAVLVGLFALTPIFVRRFVLDERGVRDGHLTRDSIRFNGPTSGRCDLTRRV